MYDENKTKNVLVTGGTRGIGAAIVKEFISKGYSVFYTGTKENDSNENYIQCDFLDEDSLFQFKEKKPDKIWLLFQQLCQKGLALNS